jgi:biotin carboxyl carrier protein
MRSALGLTLLVLVLAPPAFAGNGGVSPTTSTTSTTAHAPAAPTTTSTPNASGAVQFGQHVPPPPPVSTLFSVSPSTLRAGHVPKIVLRIDELRVHKVSVRITFQALRGDGTTLNVDGGRQATNRRVVVSWPAHAALAAGRYRVVLHATAPHGLRLQRGAHASGRTALTVKPAPPKPKPTPAPAPATTPTTPAIAPATSAAGTFPVQGPHSYGDGFGAPRKGYTHQGQDVLAALGTPVVAPLAGTIDTTGYQATAAGYYVVENAVDGHSFFFAHCAHASVAVTPGEAVAQGQQLCHVGQTGDATGPHLHFELWIGGWRVDAASHPIDPLAQLKAWDH